MDKHDQRRLDDNILRMACKLAPVFDEFMAQYPGRRMPDEVLGMAVNRIVHEYVRAHPDKFEPLDYVPFA